MVRATVNAHHAHGTIIILRSNYTVTMYYICVPLSEQFVVTDKTAKNRNTVARRESIITAITDLPDVYYGTSITFLY